VKFDCHCLALIILDLLTVSRLLLCLLLPACLQVKVLRGLEEPLARFYVGSIVLALEYLHENSMGGWMGRHAGSI
jgi:hypothetical protein